MGRARPIVLETRTFVKAGDAASYFSRILTQQSVGAQLKGEAADDVRALLNRHDEVEDKIGSGVSYIYVDSAPEPFKMQKCFWIMRTDGSKTDFSYKHCLEKKATD